MSSPPRSIWRPDLLLVLILLGFAIGKRLVLLPAWTQLSLAGYALICAITIKRRGIDRRLGWFLAFGAISLQPL